MATGQLSNWMSFVGSATVLFPADGRGASSAAIVTSTAGSTTYTETTVTDSAPWSMVGVAVGDYIYTSVAIDQLIIATTTGGAVVITDQKGTAYPGMSFAPVTGHPKTFNFGPPGLLVNAPFGINAAAGASGIILYRPLE